MGRGVAAGLMGLGFPAWEMGLPLLPRLRTRAGDYTATSGPGSCALGGLGRRHVRPWLGWDLSWGKTWWTHSGGWPAQDCEEGNGVTGSMKQPDE